MTPLSFYLKSLAKEFHLKRMIIIKEECLIHYKLYKLESFFKVTCMNNFEKLWIVAVKLK